MGLTKADGMELKPLFISKTQGEWDIINARMKEVGKNDLGVFIRHEVRKLITQIQSMTKDENFDGKKITKRPYIPVETWETLGEISEKLEIPISSVVDRFIINPIISGNLR